VSHGASAMPSEKKLVPGSAIWLKRANPTGPFYVYGGYRASLTTPVTAGAFNLIANPLDVATEIPGKETGDQVMVVNSATSTLRYRYSAKNGGWASQLADGTWSTPGELKIPVGQGVWYAPKTSRTITWR